MAKIKLTVTESKCRSGYCKMGDSFIVEDICSPVCAELWNIAYPYIFTLQNGGILDNGNKKIKYFDAKCPDEGRVIIHGEIIEE